MHPHGHKVVVPCAHVPSVVPEMTGTVQGTPFFARLLTLPRMCFASSFSLSRSISGCVRLWCQALEEVEAKTVAGILTLIERERTGVDVNRPLLRSLLRMLSALQVRSRTP